MERILLVEDDEGASQMFLQALTDAGFSVTVARDGREGIARLKETNFDLVLTDLKLPYKNGLEILHAAREQNPLMPVVLITAFATIETAVQAVKEGAADFLKKPADPDEVVLKINQALEKQRLVMQNMLLKEEIAGRLNFPRIIGKSPGIVQAIENLKKVSDSRATVLLLGESGTGKELFARAIHFLSQRKEAPFVAINCAAIPRELLESELFGHERGSFTGAVGRKLGKFELADRGTIFLDEIGEMELSLQAKLLRVLEGEELMRVGGVSKVKIDIRVIAATNRDLAGEVLEKRFREDLYYRLSVFPIVIPPLRDRREDIPALVRHFVEYYSKEMKKESKEMSPEAMNLLTSHLWTGNVRELQNAIERGVLLADGKMILPEHLGIKIKGPGDVSMRDIPEEGTLAEVSEAASRIAETRLIMRVLKETGGNKTRAAEALEVSYKTLLTKIKEYGIERVEESPPQQ